MAFSEKEPLMTVCCRICITPTLIAMFLAIFGGSAAFGQPPIINTVFPAGGQAGQTVEVTVEGTQLQGLRSLNCNASGVTCEQLPQNHFRLKIPANTPPGLYDLWAAGENGLTNPRTFAIGRLTEQTEIEPNESLLAATAVPLNCVINGRADKAGDADHFRFEAKREQRIVIECSAERIDSRLRAVLEIFDATGKRLAVNRGYFGIDPLLDFVAPADGPYVVKIQDLISSGSPEHYYRLEIDTGPRVAFSVPNVVQRGQSTRVALYGWNLASPVSGAASPQPKSGAAFPPFDCLEVDVPAAVTQNALPLAVQRQPSQAVCGGFAFQLPGSQASLMLGVTDVPVVCERRDHGTQATALKLKVPCEVIGQLTAGDQCDWFEIEAQHGEVFYLEAFGQRIHSPVDLQISVARDPLSNFASASNHTEQNIQNPAKVDLPATKAAEGHGTPTNELQELVQFNDEVKSLGTTFPTNHLDPAGRWTCPSTGKYFIAVRNLIGGLQSDPRRIYRLSLRREEPDFELVAAPRRDNLAGLNVQTGGREILEILAFRRRGCDGPICVSARDLPSGVECPDVWLGPGVDRTSLVITADRNASALISELKLEGRIVETVADASGIPTPSVLNRIDRDALSVRPVHGSTTIRTGTPSGWGRLTSQIPFAVAGIAPLRITANGHEPLDHHLYGKLKIKHSPGGVLDVTVDVDRRDSGHQAPVKLIAVGLPELIRNQTTVIPSGQHQGHLSFYLPPTLPIGTYSVVIRAETTILTAGQKPEAVVVYSNPVTFDVQPSAFLVEVDPFAVTQARRGEIIQVGYTARRQNGFIGKMHTELAVPGHITEIPGLRGRGETSTGQTEKGSLQITINDDAPLGRLPFLRLFTVGVVEDEPTYYGSSFLSLEIVE
jgi:hypothetical protein